MTKSKQATLFSLYVSLHQDAINVQNASNLTGVVHGFSRAMQDLRALFPNERTEFYNKHPISVLWADKIKSLTGDDFSGAYNEAMKIIETKGK